MIPVASLAAMPTYSRPPVARRLRAWLLHPEEDVIEMCNEGLLKLRFAGVLDPAERSAVVQRMRDYHAERVKLLQSRLAGDEFDDPYHRLTTEYAVGWNTWARDWCDSTLTILATRRPLGAGPRRPLRGPRQGSRPQEVRSRAVDRHLGGYTARAEAVGPQLAQRLEVQFLDRSIPAAVAERLAVAPQQASS
jgi:hypothetical protein